MTDLEATLKMRECICFGTDSCCYRPDCPHIRRAVLDDDSATCKDCIHYRTTDRGETVAPYCYYRGWTMPDDSCIYMQLKE